MKSALPVNYSELRSVYSDVIDYVREKAPWQKDLSANTSIENDLGLYGLESAIFIDEFSKKFELDVSDLEYADHFTPEDELFNPAFAFFSLLFLPATLLKAVFALLVWPFSAKIFSRIKTYRFIPVENNVRKDVTIGDLIISVIRGEFSERKNFVLALR